MADRRLKELRMKVGLTQQEVADILGVTKSTISKYENETRRVNADHLEKLSELYHVEPLYILCGVTSEQWDKESEKRVQAEMDFEREYWSNVLLPYPIRPLLPLLERLNEDGQQKVVERAVEHAEELTEIPRYCAETAPQSTLDSTEGTDTTQPPDASEKPPEGE